jgi:hypothetical protein
MDHKNLVPDDQSDLDDRQQQQHDQRKRERELHDCLTLI